MKIDWKKKLTSRKFWLALVGFVTPLLLAFKMESTEVTQIVSIIMAGGSLIAYVLGESAIDAADAGGTWLEAELGDTQEGEKDGISKTR